MCPAIPGIRIKKYWRFSDTLQLFLPFGSRGALKRIKTYQKTGFRYFLRLFLILYDSVAEGRQNVSKRIKKGAYQKMSRDVAYQKQFCAPKPIKRQVLRIKKYLKKGLGFQTKLTFYILFLRSAMASKPVETWYSTTKNTTGDLNRYQRWRTKNIDSSDMLPNWDLVRERS